MFIRCIDRCAGLGLAEDVDDAVRIKGQAGDDRNGAAQVGGEVA
ncbi:MAG TPA: hypothetical protein VEK56_01205 [Vicinamibacterales bacterium]|nr:hypothetical protein [Vicinamibacterales bacterium]